MIKRPEKTGLNEDTIRYYEEIHLLPRSKWGMPIFLGWILAALLLASPLPAPKVVTIQTSPVVTDEFATVLLPDGSGTLHIEANVKNAERVYFWLTYMELVAEEDSQLLYEDSNGSDGWAVDFPYDKDEGFSYQLIVEAKRGSASDIKSVFVHHDIGLDEG